MSESSRFDSQIAESVARARGALSRPEVDRDLLQAELQNTCRVLLEELRQNPHLLVNAIKNDRPLIS